MKTGSGVSKQDRHRKVDRDSILGLTKASMRRIGQRAGVKRFSSLVHQEMLITTKIKLENIIKDIVTITEHRRKKTVSPAEVDTVLKMKGIHLGMVPSGRKKLLNLNIYINRVSKQVHPHGGINSEALAQINQFNISILNRLTLTARDLAITSKTKTITSRDIQSAVRIVLPGELAKHALSEGQKSVAGYNAAKERKEELKKKGEKVEKSTKADMAGLTVSPSRIRKLMSNYQGMGMRMGDTSSVYMAAVIEYLMAEVLELSGNLARDNNKVRITSRDLFLVIENDEELRKLAKDMNFILTNAGVLPHIHTELLPKKIKKELDKAK